MSATLPDTTAAPRWMRDAPRLAAAGLAALVLVIVGYAAVATPGAWFPRQEPVAWNARQMTLVRGAGSIVGDALVVTSSGPDGTVLISLDSDLRSDQYPAIASGTAETPSDSSVSLGRSFTGHPRPPDTAAPAAPRRRASPPRGT